MKLKNSKSYLRLKNKAGFTLPPVNDVPVLIPDKALAAIKGAEAEPYEIIEAIPFPSEGQGGVYTGSYFDSLLAQMKTRPLGGSKTGHDNERDDFFTIGGKTDYTGENSGVCYLRIMIPEQGYETTNSGFIRSCKTGNQEFSIVANAEPTRGNDGRVYFTQDTGKARNDAVPEGAMEQAVGNAAAPPEARLIELIGLGLVEHNSDSKELIVNGKVNRNAVKAMQTANGTLATKLLTAIKKNTAKEKNTVTKEEIIQAVKAAIANNQLTLEELAQAVNLENKLRNATDEQRAKLQAAIAEALELPADTPPAELIKAVEEALKESEETAEAVAEAEANSIAGGRKMKNAQGAEADNPLYAYAKNQLSGKRGKRLKNALDALKTDPVMIALRGKQADGRPGGFPSGGYSGFPGWAGGGLREV